MTSDLGFDKLFCHLAARRVRGEYSNNHEPLRHLRRAVDSLFREPPVSVFMQFNKKKYHRVVFIDLPFPIAHTWILKRCEGPRLRILMKKES